MPEWLPSIMLIVLDKLTPPCSPKRNPSVPSVATASPPSSPTRTLLPAHSSNKAVPSHSPQAAPMHSLTQIPNSKPCPLNFPPRTNARSPVVTATHLSLPITPLFQSQRARLMSMPKISAARLLRKIDRRTERVPGIRTQRLRSIGGKWMTITRPGIKEHMKR